METGHLSKDDILSPSHPYGLCDKSYSFHSCSVSVLIDKMAASAVRNSRNPCAMDMDCNHCMDMDTKVRAPTRDVRRLVGDVVRSFCL